MELVKLSYNYHLNTVLSHIYHIIHRIPKKDHSYTVQFSSSHKYDYIHTGSLRNNRNPTPHHYLKGKKIRKQEPISIEKAKKCQTSIIPNLSKV